MLPTPSSRSSQSQHLGIDLTASPLTECVDVQLVDEIPQPLAHILDLLHASTLKQTQTNQYTVSSFDQYHLFTMFSLCQNVLLFRFECIIEVKCVETMNYSLCPLSVSRGKKNKKKRGQSLTASSQKPTVQGFPLRRYRTLRSLLTKGVQAPFLSRQHTLHESYVSGRVERGQVGVKDSLDHMCFTCPFLRISISYSILSGIK